MKSLNHEPKIKLSWRINFPSLLLENASSYQLGTYACVCACVHACARARVCVCVCVCVRVWVGVYGTIRAKLSTAPKHRITLP